MIMETPENTKLGQHISVLNGKNQAAKWSFFVQR